MSWAPSLTETEVRLADRLGRMSAAIEEVLHAADAKNQPVTSKNIPAELIERLRETLPA